MSDPIFSAAPPAPEETQQPDFWDQMLANTGAAGYAGLNELGMGIPDFLLKAAAPQAAEDVESFEAEHPEAETIGNLAGLAGSLAIPVGGELRAASLLTKPLGGISDVLRSGADVASGAIPVSGLVGNALKGVLQVAPQAAIRTATGNITPQQGENSLLLGALLGGAGGLAGQVASGSGKLQDSLDNWILGSGGIGKGMVSREASYGLSPKQLVSQGMSAESLKSMTAKLMRENNLNPLTDPEGYLAWKAQNIDPVFNAVDQTWAEEGSPIQDVATTAAGMPDLKSYQEALRDPTAKDRLTQAFTTLQNGDEPVSLSLMRTIDAALHKQATLAQHDPALGTTYVSLEKAANGFSDVRNLAEEAAMKAAVKAGSIEPGDLERVKAIYPAVHLLNQAYKNQASAVSLVAPGSATMNKLALGALVGGGTAGLANPQANPGDRLKDEILGTLAGAAGGDVLNRLVSRGATGLAGKVATALSGGGAGGISDVAKAVSGAAPLMGKAAHGTPAAMGFLNLQAAPEKQQPNPIEEGPFASVPTYAELMASSNPYAHLIAQKVANIYGGQYAFRLKDDGSPYSIDDVVKKAYQETNGFAPQDAAASILTPPGGNYQATLQDLQIAKQLNAMNWDALARWYGGLGQGGLSPVRGIAATLNVGEAREAQQDVRSLLGTIPAPERPLVEAQIDAIMKLPNLSTAQRKEKINQAILSTGSFANPALMQDMGFIQ